MMICSASGYFNDKFYYGYCDSTDNQIFEDNIGLGKKNIWFSNQYGDIRTFEADNKEGHEVSNSISIDQIFENKWILYNSKPQYVEASGNIYFYETHIFYKVSSD